jgi:hypothetical protein
MPSVSDKTLKRFERSSSVAIAYSTRPTTAKKRVPVRPKRNPNPAEIECVSAICPSVVLQKITFRSLQNSDFPAARFVETRRVFAEIVAFAARFDADHPHRFVAQKRMK